MMTLPQINLYSHGTQWTESHGHFAFWGAYGCGVIAVLYVAIAEHRGCRELDGRAWKWSFALLNLGMIGRAGALLVAGFDQAFHECAIGGATWNAFLSMQGRPWFNESMWARTVFGLLFAGEFAVLVYDLVAIPRHRIAHAPARASDGGGGWIMKPDAMVDTALLLRAMATAAGAYGLCYCAARMDQSAALRVAGLICYAVLVALAIAIALATPLHFGWKALVVASAAAYLVILPATWRYLTRLHQGELDASRPAEHSARAGSRMFCGA